MMQLLYDVTCGYQTNLLKEKKNFVVAPSVIVNYSTKLRKRHVHLVQHVVTIVIGSN